MPELAIHKLIKWNNFYLDFVKTYIERDVRALTQVADETVFIQFMTVCAPMTGQILNLASLARDIGISEPTAKRCFRFLKPMALFTYCSLSRLTKSKK
ncbi:MAG: hypothetical protein H3C43_10200 [Leptonema sp. (in: Bacteria)]|nr:hypothetical protein [Leptonema sp. (in: bacteria)]